MSLPKLRPTLAFVLAAPLLLAACSMTSSTTQADKVYQSERFQADETYSRLFDAKVADACEAARRALLSQGYVITPTTLKGQISGVKRFQPDGDIHVEITIGVVCIADGRNGEVTTAYVSAQQDRYAIKRSPNSASIGVSAIGSISMPLSSSQDSMVKVASETIPAGTFYDRFFALMQKMLTDAADDSAASADAK